MTFHKYRRVRILKNTVLSFPCWDLLFFLVIIPLIAFTCAPVLVFSLLVAGSSVFIPFLLTPVCSPCCCPAVSLLVCSLEFWYIKGLLLDTLPHLGPHNNVLKNTGRRNFDTMSEITEVHTGVDERLDGSLYCTGASRTASSVSQGPNMSFWKWLMHK